MNVLVTGAAGFIGSHLCDRFLADGHLVYGFDNLATGRRENLPANFPLIRGDVADAEHVRDVFRLVRPRVVFHAAASYKDPDDWTGDISTNTRGSAIVAEQAKAHGAHLVYFQTALPPISSYAASKIAGEHYIRLSGVSAMVFRLANIYGPRNLSGPIPTFYKRLSAGQPCTVTETRRDTVHIRDLIELVGNALYSTGKVDVCSGYAYPIFRYHAAVSSATGIKERPTVIPQPADDVNQLELDPQPALTRFGWRATTQLEEGIKETVRWYAEHGVGDTYTHLQLGKAA